MSSRSSSKVVHEDNDVWEAKRIGGHAVETSLLSSIGMNGQYVVYATTPCTIAILTWPSTQRSKDSEQHFTNNNDNNNGINNRDKDKIVNNDSSRIITTSSAITDITRVANAFAQMKVCSLPEPEEDEIAFVKAHASKDLLCVGTTRRGLYLTSLSSPQLNSSTRLPLSVTGELTYGACFITISKKDKKNNSIVHVSNNNNKESSYKNSIVNMTSNHDDEDVLIFSSAMKGRAGMTTSRLTLWSVQNKSVMWRGPMEAVIGLASLPHCLQFAAWTANQVFVCTLHVTSTASPTQSLATNNAINHTSSSSTAPMVSSNLSNNNNNSSNAVPNKIRLRVTMSRCNTVDELSGVQYVQCVISEMSSEQLYHSSELASQQETSLETENTNTVGSASKESIAHDEDKTVITSGNNLSNTLLALTTNGILIAFDMSCGLVYRWMNCRVRPALSLYLTPSLIVIAGAMLRLFSRQEWAVCGKLKVENTSQPHYSSSSYETKLTLPVYTSALCPLRDGIMLFTNKGEVIVYEMQHKAALYSNNNANTTKLVTNGLAVTTTASTTTNDAKAVTTTSSTSANKGSKTSAEQSQTDKNAKIQNDSAGNQRVTTIVSAKEKFIGLHKCYHYSPQFHNVHSNTMFVLPYRSTDMSTHVDEQTTNQELLQKSAREHNNEETADYSSILDKENKKISRSNNDSHDNVLDKEKKPSWALWCPSFFTLFNDAMESCKVNEMESSCALYHAETRSFITFTPTTRELVAYSTDDAWREWARLTVNDEITQLCCAYSGDRLAALDSQRHVHTFTCYWKYVEAPNNGPDDHVWNAASVASTNANETSTTDSIEENSNLATFNSMDKSANVLEEQDKLHEEHTKSHFVTKSLILAPKDDINYSHLGNLECIFFVGNTLFGATDRSLLDLDKHVVKLRELSRHAPLAACGAGRYLAVILYRNNCLSYHIESGVLDRVPLPHSEATKLCFDAYSNLLVISSPLTIAVYSVTDKITLTSTIRHDWLRSTPSISSSSSLFVSSLSNPHQPLSTRQKVNEQSASDKFIEKGCCIVSVGILSTMTENFSSTASLLYVLDLRGSITVYALSLKTNKLQLVTKGKAHILQSPEPEYTPHSTSCQENKELQRELKDETNEPTNKASLCITNITLSSATSTLAKRQVVLPLSLKSTKNSILSNRFRLDSPPSSSSIPSGDLAIHRSTSNVNNTTTTTAHEDNYNGGDDDNQREEEASYQKHYVSNSEESNIKDRHSTPHYRSNSRPHRLSGRHGSHHTRTYSEDVPSCRELSEQLDALSLYAEQSEMQSRSMRNRSSSHSNSSFYKHHHHHRELRRTNSGRFSESRRDSATDHEPEKEHEHQITTTTTTTTTTSEEEFDNNTISSTLISASDQSVLELLQITPREQIQQHETDKQEEAEQENETELENKAQLTPTHASQKMNSLYNSPGQPHALEELPEPTPFDVTQFTRETSQSKNNSSKHHDPYARTQITLLDNNASNEYKSSMKKLKPANILESSSELVSNVQLPKELNSDDDYDSRDIRNSNIVNESNEQMYREHHVLDSMVDVQVSALTSVSLSSNYNNTNNNSTKLRLTSTTRSNSSSGEHPFNELEELEQEIEEEKRGEEYKATPPLVPLAPSTTTTTLTNKVDMQPEPCERSPARKGDPLLEMEAITHTFDEDNVNYASLALTHINPEQHLRQLTQEQPQLTQHATHKSDKAKSEEYSSTQNVHRYDKVNTSHTPQTASMYSPSCSSSMSSSSSLPLLSSSSTSGSFSPHFITSTRLLRKSLQEWTHLLTSEVHSMSASRHSYSDMSTDDNTTATSINKNVDTGANSHTLMAKKMQVQEQDKELAELSELLNNALLTLQSHSSSHSARSASHSSTLLDNYDTSTVASFATNTTGNSATANNNTTTIQTAALQSIISELSHIQEQNSRLESQNAYILRKLGEKQREEKLV